MKAPRISKAALRAALLGLTACSGGSSTGVRTGVAEVQDVEQRISVSGTLRGKRSSYINPAYAGYVADVKVKLGDRIKENDPLVRILQTVDQPLGQVFPLRAPFSGVVTQVLKNPGEYVNAPTSASSGVTDGAIMRLDDLSEFWIDAAVPEIDIAKITNGQKAVIRPNALNGASYEGVVRDISLSSKESQDRWDRGKVEFAISIQITNPDEKLRPGMSAVLDVIAAKVEKVITLPHEFVNRRENSYYVVDIKGKEFPVEVGLTNESLVEIKKGISAGLEVQMIDFSQITPGGAGARRRRSR